jgi:tripartite-type tricarboxylate transporter receptor subunit TctC
MRTLIHFAVAALFSTLGPSPWAQTAQNWPERTVRLITPVPPGGSPDVVARLFPEKFGERWKMGVVVDNRPGADGVIAVQSLLEAIDNHTLLVAPSGILTVTPVIRKVPFDPDRDVRPLSMAAVDLLGMAVPASSSIGSLSELVALASEKPGVINWFASTGAPAMAFAEFLRKNRLHMVYVPYKGGPEALRDLAEDRIQVAVVPLAPLLPLADAGKVRILAVNNPERAPNLPRVATVAEAGYPELSLQGVLGFFAPKSMPEDLAWKIVREIQAVADDPSMRSRLATTGQIARSSTPAAYKQYLDEQRLHWSGLAKPQEIKSGR